MTRPIITASVAASLVVASLAFGQMKYSRTRSQSPTPTPTPTSQQKAAPLKAQSPTPPPKVIAPPVQGKPTPQPRATAIPPQSKPTPLPRTTPAPAPVKPTPTPVPPPDVKAYLDRQIAKSKDQKFHMNVNGGDLALTPFHFWPQKNTGANSTSTSISMRSDEGRVYDIEFVSTGAQVTGIRISRINGESVR
jgi:outer membrane biosynthesis protein TonB